MTFTLKKDCIQVRKTNGEQNATCHALLVVSHFLSFFVSNITFTSIFSVMSVGTYLPISVQWAEKVWQYMFGNPGWSGVQSSHQVDSEKLPGKSLSYMEKVQSHHPFCKPQTQHGLSSALMDCLSAIFM